MDSSPFAKLSPETRNRIYALVFTNEQPFEFFALADHSLLKPSVVLSKHSLSLAFTCGTIHHKSTQLFYATNSFIFHGIRTGDALDSLERFSRRIGNTNALALRSVKLDVGSWFCQHHYNPQIREAMYDLRRLLTYLVKRSYRHPGCEYQAQIAFQFDYMDSVKLCMSVKDLEDAWGAALEPIKNKVLSSPRIGQNYGLLGTLLRELRHCRDCVRAANRKESQS